jgi:DNA-binding response OmpR family regulator
MPWTIVCFLLGFVEDSGILFDFDVAADAKEASAFLDKHRYQLVLLDINLPGDNGFQWVQSEKERTCRHTRFCFDNVAVLQGSP